MDFAAINQSIESIKEIASRMNPYGVDYFGLSNPIVDSVASSLSANFKIMESAAFSLKTDLNTIVNMPQLYDIMSNIGSPLYPLSLPAWNTAKEDDDPKVNKK